MDYKKSYMLLHVGVLSGAFIAFIGLSIGTKIALLGNIIGGIGLVAMLVGIGQAFIYYKCPSCKTRLNIRGKNLIIVRAVAVKLTCDTTFCTVEIMSM